MQQKTFVIDTNVLLYDPGAFLQFPHSIVVVPLMVLEELDAMKKLPSELGLNARKVIKLFDSLKSVGAGDLHKGITMENGATIRIQIEYKMDSVPGLGLLKKRNQIIMAASLLLERGERVVFVSKNLAARVKAEAVGIEAQDYEKLKVPYEHIFSGVREVDVPKRDIDTFIKDGLLPVEEMIPNEYCVMRAEANSSSIGRYNANISALESMVDVDGALWGITPLNTEQRCALDLLLRDDVNLVTLTGPAGTGKTLLALASAMHKVFDEGRYTRILVSRPIVPMGKDIGYLPGTKEEKLVQWMQPIYDNLAVICDAVESGSNDTLQWVMESNKIEMEAVTYIRGRSLPKIFMIVDEAQNLTPHHIKTIISRAGEGTKVVFTGDPTQIDNPYLDSDSNGLTIAVEKFKNYPIAGHISLTTTERSQLAGLAAQIM